MKSSSDEHFVGFRCWNEFEREIRLLQQLYDFTAHLYTQEHNKLKSKRTRRGPGRTMHTTVGTITHNINTLYAHTRGSYPNKIRELILVSAITSFEVYLSNLIDEISKRSLEPFMSQTPLSLLKAQALSYPSIEALQEDIINREIRNLTNGGLSDFTKFFQAKFSIDLKNLKDSLYQNILEVHERRHLIVHRNGICDARYAHRHPEFNYEPEQKIYISHDYIINSLNRLKEFAALIKNAALLKYPTSNRKRKTAKGDLPSPKLSYKPLLVRIEITNSKYDGLASIPDISVKTHRKGESASSCKIRDFTYQMIQEESLFFLVIGASDKEVKAIMYALKHQDEFIVRSVSQVFGD